MNLDTAEQLAREIMQSAGSKADVHVEEDVARPGNYVVRVTTDIEVFIHSRHEWIAREYDILPENQPHDD